MLGAKAICESRDELTVVAGIPEGPLDVQEHPHAGPGLLRHPISQSTKNGRRLIQLIPSDENAVFGIMFSNLNDWQVLHPREQAIKRLLLITSPENGGYGVWRISIQNNHCCEVFIAKACVRPDIFAQSY